MRQALGRAAAGCMKEANKAGAEPLVEGIKSFIRDDTGDLRRSVQVTERNGKDGDWQAVRIGPVQPMGAHAFLVEYGHALVKGGALDEGGKVVGNVPPHPFIRPGCNKERIDRAQAIQEETIRKALEGV